MFKSARCYISQMGKESRVVVMWELDLPVGYSAADYSVSVWRTEGPDETLKPISGLMNAGKYRQYLDLSTKLLDVQRSYTYQVRLARTSNISVEHPAGFVAQTEPFSWDSPRDVVQEFVVGEHNFKFRYVSGVPILVFNRRFESDGTTCPNCWNPVLKKVMRSDCTVCFGTGIISGFYDPVYTWADLSPESNSTQIVEWGEKQPSQMDVLFTDYPRLRSKDMIVELSSGKHWVIVNAMSAERRRSAMLQLIRVDMVNPSDVEYKIEIPAELKERGSRELSELRRNHYTL